MTLLRFSCLIWLTIILSACSVAPDSPENLNINQHQQQLAEIQRWSLRGRIAFKSPEDKFSATVNWAQQQANFDMTFTSFIGTTLMEMQSEPGLARLSADDKEYQDTDASRLIYRITGWNIPVNRFPAWIKGQVDSTDVVTFDNNGLVTEVLPSCRGCQQWQIKFAQYKPVGLVWLPHSIVLNNLKQQNNQIKIRISSWTLN